MLAASRLATKTSRRVFAFINCCNVGQEVGGEVNDVGLYASDVISASVNSAWRSEVEASSLLTRRIVTTSLGLLSIHSFMSFSQSLRRPASRRSQEEWQRCQSPLFS